MFQFQIKLALKNILRSPLHSGVNVTGLSLALMCVMFIALWLMNELRYDKHIPNYDRLYRVTVEVNNPEQNQFSHFARPYQTWLAGLKSYFPEIEEEVRLFRNENYNIKINNNVFHCRFHKVDKQFLSVFGIQLEQGNPALALENPNSVVISKAMAQKYFGQSNAMGKTMQVYCRNCSEKQVFTVTGIMANMPETSHFIADMLASVENTDNDFYWAYYYILLKPGVSPTVVLEKMPGFIKNVGGEQEAKISTCHLQNVADIHLYSNKNRELEINGSIANVVVFIAIACFILLVVLVNYFNIRLVSFLNHTKNRTVCKTFGAQNFHLAKTLILELLFINLTALLISILLIKILLPYFNALSNKNLIFIQNFQLLVFVGFTIVIVAIIIGLLPLIFSGRNKSLASQLHEKNRIFQSGKLNITKALIVFQFVVAVMLTIGAIVMSRQVKLLLNKRLGANEFNIVSIDNQPVQIKNNYLSFKSDLLSSPLIHDVTSGMEVPGSEIMDRMEFTTNGIVDDFKNKMPYIFPADANYFSFFNIPLIAGQNFPPYNGNDSLPESYIINESVLKLWGWTAEEALGKPFSLIFKINENKNLFNGGRIIGVVKDFQLSSSKNKVQPMVYFQKSCWMFNSLIKIDTAQKNEALNFIRQTWKKHYADYECDIRFVDDLYNALYYKEIQQQKLVSLFTFLAIFISCLGLWSISNVISKKRTKEIGIRKANGAKTIEIMMLLNKEFLTLVAAAIFIAIPLSYFLLQKWLQSYAYQVPLHWDAFFIASILAILTSVLTVSWQSWYVAVKNPVESLRYE